MIRRIAAAAALFLSAGLCFAELYPESRYGEVSVDVTGVANENVLTAQEVFVKDLVIDLTKLADSMDDSGMIVNAGADAGFSLKANFGKKFGAGLFFDVDASARMGISKDFFDLLGNGNEIGEDIVTAVNVGMEMYMEVGTPIKFKIGKLGIKVVPSYFIPLVYMPNPDATITVSTDSSGNMKAVGTADFAIYSAVDMGMLFDTNFNFLGTEALLANLSDNSNILDIFRLGGTDLNAEVEYPVFRSLDVGVYTRVPVVPGRLSHVTTGTATYSATMSPVLNYLADSSSGLYSTDGPNFAGVSFGDDTYLVNRPFKLGVEGAWRPFGKWCTFRPLIGFGARNPFGEDFSWKTSVYPEYNLGVDMRFFYVLGLNFATSYYNEVFAQKAGLVLNMRVLELDVAVASTSSSFIKSWQLSGLQAVVSVKLGF